MSEYVSIAEWSKINGRTRGAGVNALKSIPGALNEKGKVLASTPWPHAPRKGGWPKGKARGIRSVSPEQRASIERGLAQPANGEATYIGSFAQYAVEE